MGTPTALVLDNTGADNTGADNSDARPPVTIGGLTLTERAIVLADRAGLDVAVWGPRDLALSSRERLRRRGVDVRQQSPERGPLEGLPQDEATVIIGSQVLLSPAALLAFVNRAVSSGGEVGAVFDAGVPLLLYLPPGATAGLGACRSVEKMVTDLSTRTAGVSNGQSSRPRPSATTSAT
jgi:hypothetical protein